MKRTSKRTFGSVAAVFAIFATFVALAPAAGATETIASGGPLDEIIISDDLACQVSHTDDAVYEFYPEDEMLGACNTQISIDGETFGPADVPAGNSPTPYGLISQGAVTGTGTSADPYEVVTGVTTGQAGLDLYETDTYVTGEEKYRTDVEIDNENDFPIDAIVYRAGDCYLNNSDDGFGATAPVTGGTAVSCVGSDDEGLTPNNRVETWIPLTEGSNYMEGFYDDVWTEIQAGNPLPDTCTCDEYLDNGAGLSWEITVPAFSSVTVSHLTVFSPDNVVAVTKSADAPTSDPGAVNGYTITVDNATAGDITIDEIVDTLPPGFSYRGGTTTDATTADPTVDGQTLTWTGPFDIPAGESIALHFDVDVSTTPGVYFNEATATGLGFTVTGTGPTAQIEVVAPPTAPVAAPALPVTAAQPTFTG